MCRDRALMDRWGYPGGIGWNRNMRFATGLGLLDFTLQLERTHMDVAFPFIIFHDPADQIVMYGPSERLANESPSSDRTLVPLPGVCHDIMSAEPMAVAERVIPWLLSRAAKTSDVGRTSTI